MVKVPDTSETSSFDVSEVIGSSLRAATESRTDRLASVALSKLLAPYKQFMAAQTHEDAIELGAIENRS